MEISPLPSPSIDAAETFATAYSLNGVARKTPSPPNGGSTISLSDSEESSGKFAQRTAKEAEEVPKYKKKTTGFYARAVNTGDFEPERHFYPRVLNANIHPLVASFFSLGNERILARYTHLNPQVNAEALKELLAYRPKFFQWAGTVTNIPLFIAVLSPTMEGARINTNGQLSKGSDLFNVTTASGQRQMIIVETNSCPSGQKSMPLLSDPEEYGGYGVVIEHTFKEMIMQADKSLGDLAVVCDKNMMEASGYAAVMAEATGERVWLAEYYWEDPDPPVKWEDGVMYLRDEKKGTKPIYSLVR